MLNLDNYERVAALHERNGTMDVQRNVHISLRHRYVCVALPKVANSTLKGILQQEELRGTTFKVDDIHDRLASPLIAPFQLHPSHFERLLTEEGFFRFVFVRNPFTRLLSCYLDRVRALKSVPRRQIAEALGQPVEADISFAAFVSAVADMEPRQMNEHFRPQTQLACPDLIAYDMIGRFESFDDDLARALANIWPRRAERINTRLNLSPRATGADSQVAEHYTPALADCVREVFVDDFEAFGYGPELPG